MNRSSSLATSIMLAGRAALVTARVTADGEVLRAQRAGASSGGRRVARARRDRPQGVPHAPHAAAERRLRRPARSSDRASRSMRIACATSRPAMRSRSRGSIWNATNTPRRCFASSDIPASETPVVIGREGRFLRRPVHRRICARCAGLDVARRSAEIARPRSSSAPARRGSPRRCTRPPRDSTSSSLERLATGGQAGTSSRIENYLGFPAGISGAELTRNALLQAQRFGARITVPGPSSVSASTPAFAC